MSQDLDGSGRILVPVPETGSKFCLVDDRRFLRTVLAEDLDIVMKDCSFSYLQDFLSPAIPHHSCQDCGPVVAVTLCL